MSSLEKLKLILAALEEVMPFDVAKTMREVDEARIDNEMPRGNKRK